MSKGKKIFPLVWLLLCGISLQGQIIEISEDALRDKINGGLLGQFFGNLNGLKHENQYFEEPGNVSKYVPDLSSGAYTDDDTDIEFVYIYHMDQAKKIFLPHDKIQQLWEDNINEHIWCSNRYARNLMSLGIEPPFTGRIMLNPWAHFNISGQFLCEQFGLIAPGMPNTAARIGTHYTHVAVDGEPIQTTQLFDAMIACAFFQKSIQAIIDSGLAAVDEKSEIHEIGADVVRWHQRHPKDWRRTRAKIKEKYWEGTWGGPGGSNGYRTITAATLGALLHGRGDFVESIRLAFNFGWDADNISAMVGTIVGVIKGEDWIRAQGWKIKNQYLNNRRPSLPRDWTIDGFAAMHFRLAHHLILKQGGKLVQLENGDHGYQIQAETPTNIEPLSKDLNRIESMRQTWLPRIRSDLGSSEEISLARAAYVTTCLGLTKALASDDPENWLRARNAFKPYYGDFFEDEQWPKTAREYFHSVIFKGVIPVKHPLTEFLK